MSKNWREAHFQVKMYKIARVRTTFGSLDVEKWHAAVARSTFSSQNVREAHLQVKMYKTPHCRSMFGHWAVENLHAAVARSTFASQNVKNMRCSGHFLTCGCRKMVGKWRQARLQVKLYKTFAFCSTFRGFTGQVN